MIRARLAAKSLTRDFIRGFAFTSQHQRKILTQIDTKADFVSRNDLLFKDEESKTNAYPALGKVLTHDAPVVRIPEFRNKWSDTLEFVEGREPNSSDLVGIQGRVTSVRRAGKNLHFIDITQDFDKLQVVVNNNRIERSSDSKVSPSLESMSLVRRGDIIHIYGVPWRTRSGELSILALRPVRLLTPCLHPLPESSKLNETTKLHNRVVDLASSNRARETLRARSTIIREIRRFFEAQGFTEVQTPILSSQASGATAEPFRTKSRAIPGTTPSARDDGHGGQENELCLRIAPELWLKRLVISGFDKVFEIGPCFRNEGIDATHNPEFTSCEFYQSYTTLEQLIELTETLLKNIAQAVRKEHDLFTPQIESLLEIINNQGFRQVDFISEIEKQSGRQLPEDLMDVQALCEFFRSVGKPLPHNTANVVGDTNAGGDIAKYTPSKLLDELASHFIEPQCQAPTFIINHPSVMAPLSKAIYTEINGIRRHVSRRMELFIQGKEYVNAYEEENSPFVQRENFERQARDHDKDSEEPIPDYSYVAAMEWGLPPTGGWGMGVDRLCMLLTGSERIAQVLAFGGIKVVNYQ